MKPKGKSQGQILKINMTTNSLKLAVKIHENNLSHSPHIQFKAERGSHMDERIIILQEALLDYLLERKIYRNKNIKKSYPSLLFAKIEENNSIVQRCPRYHVGQVAIANSKGFMLRRA